MNKKIKIFGIFGLLLLLVGGVAFAGAASNTYLSDGISWFKDKVGFGTDTPTEAVDVIGNIKATGNITTNNIQPDKVLIGTKELGLQSFTAIVDSDGTADYTTITDAIAGISTGTIFVRAGTYTESFSLPSNIDIVGEQGTNIVGNIYTPTGLTSDNVLKDFEIVGDINISYTRETTLQNIEITGNLRLLNSVITAHIEDVNIQNGQLILDGSPNTVTHIDIVGIQIRYGRAKFTNVAVLNIDGLHMISNDTDTGASLQLTNVTTSMMKVHFDDVTGTKYSIEENTYFNWLSFSTSTDLNNVNTRSDNYITKQYSTSSFGYNVFDGTYRFEDKLKIGGTTSLSSALEIETQDTQHGETIYCSQARAGRRYCLNVNDLDVNSRGSIHINTATGFPITLNGATSSGIDFNAKTAVDISEIEIDGISGDGNGKAVCIKADGNLGTCLDAVGVSGTCTCN